MAQTPEIRKSKSTLRKGMFINNNMDKNTIEKNIKSFPLIIPT
jgi:hypothetical protein